MTDVCRYSIHTITHIQHAPRMFCFLSRLSREMSPRDARAVKKNVGFVNTDADYNGLHLFLFVVMRVHTLN